MHSQAEYKGEKSLDHARIPINYRDYTEFLTFGRESAVSMARAARPTKDASPESKLPYWRRMKEAITADTFLKVVAIALIVSIVCVLIWPLIFVVAAYIGLRYYWWTIRKARLIHDWHAGKVASVVKAL